MINFNYNDLAKFARDYKQLRSWQKWLFFFTAPSLKRALDNYVANPNYTETPNDSHLNALCYATSSLFKFQHVLLRHLWQGFKTFTQSHIMRLYACMTQEHQGRRYDCSPYYNFASLAQRFHHSELPSIKNTNLFLINLRSYTNNLSLIRACCDLIIKYKDPKDARTMLNTLVERHRGQFCTEASELLAHHLLSVEALIAYLTCGITDFNKLARLNACLDKLENRSAFNPTHLLAIMKYENFEALITAFGKITFPASNLLAPCIIGARDPIELVTKLNAMYALDRQKFAQALIELEDSDLISFDNLEALLACPKEVRDGIAYLYHLKKNKKLDQTALLQRMTHPEPLEAEVAIEEIESKGIKSPLYRKLILSVNDPRTYARLLCKLHKDHPNVMKTFSTCNPDNEAVIQFLTLILDNCKNKTFDTHWVQGLVEFTDEDILKKTVTLLRDTPLFEVPYLIELYRFLTQPYPHERARLLQDLRNAGLLNADTYAEIVLDRKREFTPSFAEEYRTSKIDQVMTALTPSVFV